MSFDYSRMTYNNRWRVKRWSHGVRFQVALDLAKRFKPEVTQALDYGAGDGYFAQILRRSFPASEVTTFDPSAIMEVAIRNKADGDHNIRVISNPESLRGPFDIIFCLEVLEHLQDEEIVRILARWREILRKDGVVIVSVPIETGLGGAVKTGVRMSIGEGHVGRYSSAQICKAILGGKIDRGQDSYIDSHVGFSHKRLIKLIERENIIVRKTRYSPLRWAGPINSQCFWVLGMV